MRVDRGHWVRGDFDVDRPRVRAGTDEVGHERPQPFRLALVAGGRQRDERRAEPAGQRATGGKRRRRERGAVEGHQHVAVLHRRDAGGVSGHRVSIAPKHGIRPGASLLGSPIPSRAAS